METTEFKVGDVVRIKRCWLNGLYEGLELEVIRIGGACVYTKPHPQVAGGEPAFAPRDIELVRRAPASPAQEAPTPWRPNLSQRVRLRNPALTLIPATYDSQIGTMVEVSKDGGGRIVMTNGASWSVDPEQIEPIEPAPMPSGSAGKECPECGEVGKHRSSCAVLADKLDAALEHQRELNTKREWDSEKHPAPGFWPSLDERIAAARAELDQPSAERRARVSRFDPTPWQDWPKGWDDEP